MANKKLKNFEYASHTSKGKSKDIHSDDLAFFECINGFVFIICNGKVTGSSEVKPSALTTERIKYYLENEFVENPSDAVYNALVYANGFIYEYARKNPEFNDPRVSCSVLLIRNNESYYCVVGNSTISFFNGKRLFVLASGDESKNQSGEKTEDVLTGGYFLGEKQNIVPEVNREPLIALNDDMVMLSNDGFSDFVPEKHVLKILGDPMPVQTKVYRLTDMAVHAGSEENVSVQLVAFYNLDHTVRKFIPLRLKGKKVLRDISVHRKEKPDDSSDGDNTSQTELSPIMEKLENPAVKYTLLALGVLLVIYMFYDLFLYNPVRPVKLEPTINQEQVTEELQEEVTPIITVKIPEDRIYTVQSGDTWSRIYSEFGVCSWFIRNHPPNRGKFDSADNPVAGSRINIPVIYSSRRDLNPDFYREFSIEKTGTRCENADQEFLDKFKETHL
jgi:serine/threonine protein phosphatase PrpC